jgi:hypothetical protein
MGMRPSVDRARIVVSGAIAQLPLGGMTWHHLQYVLGFARLGHEVTYLEDTGDAPYDPPTRMLLADHRRNVSYLASVMARMGLADRWAYCELGQRWIGMSDGRRSAALRSADLLLNVSGMLDRPEAYRAVPRLAYVDTDPVFNQVKFARGDVRFRARVDAHDVHFSFGERLTDAAPVTGHRWIPTRQPIVLAEWASGAGRPGVFSTVMNWKVRSRPAVFNGGVYGQKDVEFERFIDLPRLVAPVVLEVAVNRGRQDHAPLGLLSSKGWRVVDPERHCVGLDSYRSYIRSSMAEWSVAKNGYVVGRPGWFSERSACYLAAGRPVVVQDTGFSAVLPVGEGIVPFTTVEEAAAGIRDVVARHRRHADAARAIAEQYFDSGRVLSRLVEQALA